MRFASLGSGSRGNGTVIATADSCVLVDCGFTLKETTARLARLNLTPDDLDAILVTHEHSDHAAGVSVLSRRFSLPVFLTHGTAAAALFSDAHQLVCFNAGATFSIGDIDVHAVPVPHDAREPVQYRFQSEELALGVLTDLGSLTPFVLEAYAGCTGLLLEFNHEPELLRKSAYPAALKRRVGGDFGHLNNQQAAEFLQRLDTDAMRVLVAGHLSQQNNTPGHAQEALQQSGLADHVDVTLASQSDGFDWISLVASSVDASVAASG